MATFNLTDPFYLAEIIGTTAFAISGIIEGSRRKLDAVGICMVAGLAAFGGGTLRDVLIGHRPFFWVEHDELLWFVMLLSMFAMFFLRQRHLDFTERSMQYPDALGLGLFAVTGTQLGLDHNFPLLVSVLMGVMTSVFGGVLRDIVCNQIPRVFIDHRPYAICAFLGAWALIGCQQLNFEPLICVLIGAGLATFLRLMSLWFEFRIPPWR
jgi:uncharacterized membrane protein YeiH